ncbi:hypothetical protein ACLOJK_030619 [Asimina triloba]
MESEPVGYCLTTLPEDGALALRFSSFQECAELIAKGVTALAREDLALKFEVWVVFLHDLCFHLFGKLHRLLSSKGPV